MNRSFQYTGYYMVGLLLIGLLGAVPGLSHYF